MFQADEAVMSMICRFVEVSPGLLGRLEQDPDIADVLFHEPVAFARIEIDESARPVYQERLERILGGAASATAVLERLTHPAPAPELEGKGESLSIEEAWHGVHYLLTGRTEPGCEPAAEPILGGIEIGDDQGYGPVRYYTPALVGTLAASLAAQDEKAMALRFHPERMEQLAIYPRGWDETRLEWLVAEFQKLRSFYARAAAGGNGVVTCLV